jgi:hypothetical protein
MDNMPPVGSATGHGGYDKFSALFARLISDLAPKFLRLSLGALPGSNEPTEESRSPPYPTNIRLRLSKLTLEAGRLVLQGGDGCGVFGRKQFGRVVVAPVFRRSKASDFSFQSVNASQDGAALCELFSASKLMSNIRGDGRVDYDAFGRLGGIVED